MSFGAPPIKGSESLCTRHPASHSGVAPPIASSKRFRSSIPKIIDQLWLNIGMVGGFLHWDGWDRVGISTTAYVIL